MNRVEYLNTDGSFRMENPELFNYMYFPIANELGIKSAVTPLLGGDAKYDQNTFLLEPTSVENLHNNKSGRNFWVRVDGKGLWSAVGNSAEAEATRFTAKEKTSMTAGFMWQTLERTSEKFGLTSVVTSFAPIEYNVEVMYVTLQNCSQEALVFTPVAAVPIYGRSADDLRDHRHVTSLLHRIRTTEDGVLVKPTLSFDERGHRKNEMTYFVCGAGEEGEKAIRFYPTVESFIGEGGSLMNPRTLVEGTCGVPAGSFAEGREAMGALRFKDVKLEPGKSVSFIVVMGATDNELDVPAALNALNTKEKVDAALLRVKNYWQEKVNVRYYTGNREFDNYMRWVSFQPMLRRIYGCSFLPYHDYGKGGRGWRDLWQDCLALLLMNPDGVRQMIIDNFGGVRIDGTNATIIGSKPGEFVADRNNITRVWMDHGMWPLLTVKLYIDHTGDIEILNELCGYFKDKQIDRGTDVDELWAAEQGTKLMDVSGKEYQGTVIEHLLVQNLAAVYEVGEHNNILLRGADWNDAIDMASKRGESVAFTCAYAGNLRILADYLRAMAEKTHQVKIDILEELSVLLTPDHYSFDDIEGKRAILRKYTSQSRHNVMGAKISLGVAVIAQRLDAMADAMEAHLRKNEWIIDGDCGWFNSYYDDNGRRVEKADGEDTRMMLTGQVFSVMSHVASDEQTAQICKAADKYLFDEAAGGYRLNTNFHEEKYDMGRMFGFAYGEKENGAVFSHMTVMYANALYQNGFVKEGHKALSTLFKTSNDFDTSKLYPGVPEYFRADGRGMYSYLTGAASWYMLTMVTEVFGVKGQMGDLCIEPKLVKEQFDYQGKASLQLLFAGKQVSVVIENPEFLDYGEYCLENGDGKIIIPREEIINGEETPEFKVVLKKC